MYYNLFTQCLYRPQGRNLQRSDADEERSSYVLDMGKIGQCVQYVHVKNTRYGNTHGLHNPKSINTREDNPARPVRRRRA